jgi:hypothetical protein
MQQRIFHEGQIRIHWTMICSIRRLLRCSGCRMYSASLRLGWTKEG